MVNYDAFRRDSNLSPANGGVMGQQSSPGAGPNHNLPFRHNNPGKGRLNANLDGPQGYYPHQTPPPQMPHGPPAGYYNKVGGGGSAGGHNQNEYYGKYEIEFNHHHHGQMKAGQPLNNMDHHHLHGNNIQQSPGGFMSHHQGHNKMLLNEFNNKSAVQFNNQSAAYYTNNGVNPHGQEAVELNAHAHPYPQQQQQQQFHHHQSYHGHNNNFEAMDAAYYHHHAAHHNHHHPTMAHSHGTGVGAKAGTFYENNNSINYQHEYGEMHFPNPAPVNANAAVTSPINAHHPVGAPSGVVSTTGPIIPAAPLPNNTASAYNQHPYGFEAGHHPGMHGGGQGEEDWNGKMWKVSDPNCVFPSSAVEPNTWSW